MHSMDPLPATDELEVQCFRLGDTLEVVALPGEPLESGRDRIVSARHGCTVLTVGYANAAPGYLPASSDYPHAGYEVGMSRYAAGTLEALCDAAVTLAQDLSAQRD